MIETTTSPTLRTPIAFLKASSSGYNAHSLLKEDLRTMLFGRGLACLLLLMVVAASDGVVRAQLNIPVVRGDNGLKSGSQPGPGVYISGVFYVYDSHEIVDANGTHFNRVGIDQFMPAAALTYVSKKKFLGGNYSATVVLPLLNVAIDRPQSSSTSGLGYSDTYVQPLQAEYRNSGIMSFIVSKEGTVYQKDLGEKTAEVARAMAEYNPGDGWKPAI